MQITPCLSSQQTRRDFIRNVSAALCAGAVMTQRGALAQGTSASSTATKAPVGSNIYGWSQYYQRDGKDVNQHLDEVISALHEAGYDYLEGFVDANHPENNLRFADQLRAKGLRPVCLYTGGHLHEADKVQEVLRTLLDAAAVCQKAGFTLIDCNPDPIGREKTDDELKTQAKALNELGKGLKDLGIKLGVHNHMPEMANHARELHSNFSQTDPALVGLCYDVHWVFRGGIQPADCLKQYGDRVVSWHLRQSRAGIWWEDLDTGDIDYQAIANFAKEHHSVAPLTVELALENGTKITRSAVDNHRLSREFVRRVFGA
jgi:inosose dehydratase